MKITELLEQIEMEAATQAQYVPEFREAVMAGIKTALNALAKFIGEPKSHPKEFTLDMAKFNHKDPWPGPFLEWIHTALDSVLSYYIADSLKDTVNDLLARKKSEGSDIIGQILAAGGSSLTQDLRAWLQAQLTPLRSVTFKKTKHGGYASDQDIVISDERIRELSAHIIDLALDRTYSSYGGHEIWDSEGEVLADADWASTRSEELRSQLKDMSQYDDYWLTPELVDRIVTTFVHELTHTEQHRPQQHRGRTEYRSILDRSKKSEFHDLARGYEQGILTPAQQERYWELYFASLQEIPAFSNQLARNMANDWGIFDTDNLEWLDGLVRHDPAHGYVGILNDPKSLAQQIENRTGGRFRARPGETRKTARKRQRVWRLYVTRTYQSLVAIVDSQRERIMAKQQQQNREEP
jgi:hypothetical protein